MSNIALQVERTTGGTISSAGSMIYDNVVYSAGNISYDPLTGIATISDPGRFVIDWWVSTQSSPGGSGISFALVTSEGAVIEGASPIKTGEVFGTAIVEVVNEPVTIYLDNTSGADIYLPNQVSVKASLTVVQDDIVTPAGGGAAVIPFASGNAVAVTSLIGGLAGLPAIIGYGEAFQFPTILGLNIDIFGATNLAFSMPRDGIIDSLSFFFSNTIAFNLLLGSANLIAEIYISTTPNDTFVPTGGIVSIPLTGAIAIGDTFNATANNLNIPVAAGTRILLVVSMTTAGLAVAAGATGQISAGISIL